ncbi:YsnF/AvaK domain-containing protein [Noviherbaspirillum sp. ST9]|uniref:YsnF/AvaK domain-containing protein n=1 Tax=Noviherbaspirillum sp. ST9 TaxID=3401606 RepID=UPI003B58B221
MENTVVGVYDSYAQAQNVMNELLACGFSRDEVQLSPEADRTSLTQDRDSGTGSGIGHFFRSLFGMEDEEDRMHHDVYAEAMRRGSCVVTVDADSEEERERAIEVMNRFDPVDIDERSSQWRSQGWTGYDAAAPMYTDSEIEKDRTLYGQNRTTDSTAQSMRGEQQRIPIVEEELQVGKRAVQRGGVRIYQRMTEKPVQESVTLREEHVNVERHPVDQPASEADLTAMKEGAIELRETAEEPVVSKSARVVEEVVVGKEATERTENINDTVRRTEVDVEQLGAADRSTTGATTAADTSMASGTGMRSDYGDSAMTSDDSDYRTHWQNAYGSSGGRYEDYDAAYRYGSMAGGSERYRNYRWEDAESNLRSDWERDHPESAWDKVKDAVRYGAERVTGRQRGR